MRNRGSHIRQGFSFLAGCAALGAFLFFLNNGSFDTSSTSNEAAAVEASAEAAAKDLEAEADRMEAAQAVADPPPPADDAAEDELAKDEPAGRWPNSVFGDGDQGTLTCAFPGFEDFRVDWKTDDKDGVVTVNGNKTNGTVIGDWEPAADRIRYDIHIDKGGPNDGRQNQIDISDDGTLHADNGTVGTCAKAS